MIEVGWFSTGRGEGSLGLFEHVYGRMRSGEIDGRIQFVFSNREPGEGEGSDRFFQRVRSYGLPLVTISSMKFRREVGGRFPDHREEYDRRVMGALEGFQPDVCVLAGYMLIMGGEMCRRYTMLNLHPALPGGSVGTWQDVVWNLIDSRASVTGCMVHLATEELDRGPVLAYCTLPIVGGPFDGPWAEVEGKSIAELRAEFGEEVPLFKLIRQEGYRREPWLLGAALKALAEGRVTLDAGRVFDHAGVPSPGLCLDKEVEQSLAGS